MTLSPKLQRTGNLLLRYSIPIIILLGIILRLVLFFQNRNLIIDEANIVRNLDERSFAGLVLPLHYEQYAPPVFLWIEKLCAMLFGYGEKAMRLYPLICGIGSLLVFYKVARRLMLAIGIWLPLGLFSCGSLYVRYATELKQYMPDTLIALLLIWLALSVDIRKVSRWRFALIWIAAGSLAIWSSMPSVFILSGIGAYYLWDIIKEKRWSGMSLLLVTGAIWLVQFFCYYWFILRMQISSEYLQNYHRDFFLIALPANGQEWDHNLTRFQEILGSLGGWTGVAIGSHIVFLLTGCLFLLRKQTSQFLLLVLPILLVLVAAALKQFSLIDRVILFMMPLWLLLIGIGFARIWLTPFRPVKVLLVLIGLFNIYSYGLFHIFRQKLTSNEITEGMAYIKSQGGSGSQVYLHDNNVPVYIYYTSLHPAKEQWHSLLGAHRLKWDDNYTEITKNIRDRAYFLYPESLPIPERDKRKKEIEVNMRQVGRFEKHSVVGIYVPKDQAL